ncbi:hypothetical protein M3Y98_00141600 [Aphelenchoides besseyi]|nr:hypothetical protein M3Y98_00141600 [Aphelenchoides besseyi]KAI6199707.1 hypothetical protein M3Y96_00655400 [Aphelenchoides besseyi]
MDREHSQSECQKHNTPESLWIVFDGKSSSWRQCHVEVRRKSKSIAVDLTAKHTLGCQRCAKAGTCTQILVVVYNHKVE